MGQIFDNLRGAAALRLVLMTMIRILRLPRGAFNKDRPVSSLLKAQIRHLQEAEFNLIRTEGQAAEYIRRITALMHPERAKPQIEPGRVRNIAASVGNSRKHRKKTAARKKPKSNLSKKRK
jgi:hypothetical protein